MSACFGKALVLNTLETVDHFRWLWWPMRPNCFQMSSSKLLLRIMLSRCLSIIIQNIYSIYSFCIHFAFISVFSVHSLLQSLSLRSLSCWLTAVELHIVPPYREKTWKNSGLGPVMSGPEKTIEKPLTGLPGDYLVTTSRSLQQSLRVTSSSTSLAGSEITTHWSCW